MTPFRACLFLVTFPLFSLPFLASSRTRSPVAPDHVLPTAVSTGVVAVTLAAIQPTVEPLAEPEARPIEPPISPVAAVRHEAAISPFRGEPRNARLAAPQPYRIQSPRRLEPAHHLLARYDYDGMSLALRQIERGLPKNLRSETPRDQSIQGLRDIINESKDSRIRKFQSNLTDLETAVRRRDSEQARTYTTDLIEEFAPLSQYIERQSGIPGEVILAQMVVESGWGGSNVTILKNNLMGLGTGAEDEDFTVTLKLDGLVREIPVRCLAGTGAYAFQSVGDSVLYYVYVLLQSPDNAPQYGRLRAYIRANRERLGVDSPIYRARVLRLIAEGYHCNPAWYLEYLKPVVRRVEEYQAGSRNAGNPISTDRQPG